MFDLNKISEISLGIDEHLRKLEGFMGVLREIKTSLEVLKNQAEANYRYELHQLKQEVGHLTEQLKKRGLPEANKYEMELLDLRKTAQSEDWPVAVDPSYICENEERIRLRAASILDLVVGEHLKGKRFLDFGCGQGHVVDEAIRREAAVAKGYDVDLGQCKFDRKHFYDAFERVKEHAPYDIILLHDVLDHAVLLDPVQVLQQVRSILSHNGKVYVRNHPWSSRHGGHLYQQHNKAFLHLVFDEVELTRIGGWQSQEPNIKVVTPLETYRYWFQQAGLHVKNEAPIRQKVEDFFLQPSPVQQRLQKHWPGCDSIVNYLEIESVEYTLSTEDGTANRQVF